MKKEVFIQSLNDVILPENFSDYEKALWFSAKGMWEEAHNIAQENEGKQLYDGLHAYLHRVEGDNGNAGYWYRRAGKNFPTISVKDELEEMINANFS